MTTDTRSIIIETDAEHTRRRSNRLPEKLTLTSQLTLAAAEAATVLFVSLVALHGTGAAIPAAVVTAGIIGVIAWQAGLYARSYAVYPHDEVYYACACVALSAIPIMFALIVVGNLPVGFVVAAILLAALASSVVRVRLHLQRRSGPLSSTLTSISPRGWTERESARYRITKRAFDLTIAALVFLPVCAVMLIAAVAIYLDTGLPILFRQERIGQNGIPFTIYKFRTLAEGSGSNWVKPGDGRVTRAGALLRRLSFDELPQIFNVLKGEMSLVGPRPEMTEFAREFAESIPRYAQRHVVTPGITGWTQLYYKRNLSPSDMQTVLSYDVFYVEHACAVLDLALIFKTAVELYAHRPG